MFTIGEDFQIIVGLSSLEWKWPKYCLVLLYFRNMKVLIGLDLFHFLGIGIMVIHEIDVISSLFIH